MTDTLSRALLTPALRRLRGARRDPYAKAEV